MNFISCVAAAAVFLCIVATCHGCDRQVAAVELSASVGLETQSDTSSLRVSSVHSHSGGEKSFPVRFLEEEEEEEESHFKVCCQSKCSGALIVKF